MAVLISKATGNFTAAGTWNLCSTAGALDSEAGTTNISTSNLDSATFVLEANEVNAVCLKVSSVVTPTGTLSVTLRNNTTSTNIFTVTINCSDLHASSEGWVKFLGSNHTPNGTDAYLVRVVRSVADGASNRVTLFRNATANNHSRHIVRTATQAPVAGDDWHVIGEHTGAATSNSYTVTMDETATTDYGSGSTTLANFSVGNLGTLTWGTAASTNYYLKLSGLFVIYAGGTTNVGTVGTPIPASSTAKIELDCVANVDFGLIRRTGGVLVMQGAPITNHKTLLTADVAAAGTILTVASTAGWAATEDVVIATTTQTAGQTEKRTISTVDSATQITLTSGVTNAHSGTSPTQAEVIHLTRNVKVFGASSSLQGYILFKTEGAGSADIDYVEFYNLGSSTADKRGVEIEGTQAGTNFNGCVLRDFATGNGCFHSDSANTWTISNTNFGGTFNQSVILLAGTSTGLTINNCHLLGGGTTGGVQVDFSTTGTVTITNSSFVGFNNNTGGVWSFNSIPAVGSTFDSITIHGNRIWALDFNAALRNLTFTNFTIWRNLSGGVNVRSNIKDVTFSNFTMFGNQTQNIAFNSATYGLLITGLTSSGDTTFATTSGILMPSNVGTIVVETSTFGVVSGIKTAHTQDLNISTAGVFVQVQLRNTSLASSTELAGQTNMTDTSFISSQKHDQTAGSHKTWTRYGTISIDTTIFDVSPSVRLTPNSATNKLESGCHKRWYVAVASGGSATVSIKVRESVVADGTDFNGGRIRLIVKKNVAAGISADTVLATATAASQGDSGSSVFAVGGGGEVLSGTTPTVTDDCVLEFVVDCDGTTGWINADTFAVSSGNQATGGLKFWSDGHSFAAVEPAGGPFGGSCL